MRAQKNSTKIYYYKMQPPRRDENKMYVLLRCIPTCVCLKVNILNYNGIY